eukprot:NODE_123_length_17687_cov_0.732261.p11 type:complete len:216 gc:universal NODE_123_length_17687_cov_0.732261:5427-4780(-)
MIEFISGMLTMLIIIAGFLYIFLFVYGSRVPLKKPKKAPISEEFSISDKIHSTVHNALNILLTNIARQYVDKIHPDLAFIKEFNVNIDWNGFIECTNMTTTQDYSIFTLVVHPPLMVQVQGNLFYNNIYLPFIVDVEPSSSFDIGLDIDLTAHENGSHSTLTVKLLDYQLDLAMSSEIGGTIKLKNLDKLHKILEYFIRDGLDFAKKKSQKFKLP